MSGVDHLAALPDDVLQHVLSYLPSSRDAVRSAMLARRWRHLWRSTPAVRVKGSGDGFRVFVTSLLLSRDSSSPLRSFEIDADLIIGENDESYCDEFDSREVDGLVDVWIRHAVTTCRARSLTARFDEEDIKWSPRQQQPFASPHLTTIQLNGVILADDLLDFSCCPALMYLKLSACCLEGDTLASPSLERLSIISCDVPIRGPNSTRMLISTPSLRYLRLSDGNSEFADPPSLESIYAMVDEGEHQAYQYLPYPRHQIFMPATMMMAVPADLCFCMACPRPPAWS